VDLQSRGSTRQRIEAEVGAGEGHASGSREAWIAAVLLNGAMKVVITGPHRVSLMRAYPH
jgi:hypothetical protein